MQEPYAEGLATHGGPKPCAGTRKGDGEASEGAHAGRVLSREIVRVRSADAVIPGGRQHDPKQDMRADGRLCAVVDPWHAWNLHAREPGGPLVALGDGPRAATGKGAKPCSRR